MLLLVVFGVLLSIVIGLVSSTHADIVILIALAAVLGVTPQQDHRFGVTAMKGDATHELKTLVAIGDSYLSGEGASIYYAGTDDAKKNECRRAPTSWAALAAESGYEAMSFLACSGARTGEIMLPVSDSQLPQDQGSQAFAKALNARGLIHPQDRGADEDGRQESQLEKWRRDQRDRSLMPALVVVSAGGNDAGFSTIGVMCLAPGSCDERSDLWIPTLSQVRDQLRLLYSEIDLVFPDTPVVTVGYPDPIALADKDAPPDESCGEVALTRKEQEFIHMFLTGTEDGKVDGLNDVIQQTSAEFGFHYVDTMEGALAGQQLQLCDTGNDGRPGLNFIGLRSVRGAAEQRFNPANWLHGSLHPNERGHAAMLRAFETWRAATTAASGGRLAVLPEDATAKQRLLAARATWANETPTTAIDASELPPCDLFAAGMTGCRTLGTRWAMEQIGDQLAKGWLAAMVLAGLGAWAAAVGFFGWRRIALKKASKPHPAVPASPGSIRRS
jgi:hypothetical protein